jgi:hypothetical protein
MSTSPNVSGVGIRAAARPGVFRTRHRRPRSRNDQLAERRRHGSRALLCRVEGEPHPRVDFALIRSEIESDVGAQAQMVLSSVLSSATRNADLQADSIPAGRTQRPGAIRQPHETVGQVCRTGRGGAKAPHPLTHGTAEHARTRARRAPPASRARSGCRRGAGRRSACRSSAVARRELAEPVGRSLDRRSSPCSSRLRTPGLIRPGGRSGGGFGAGKIERVDLMPRSPSLAPCSASVASSAVTAASRGAR